MDIRKLLLILCVFCLAVCLVFSVTALTGLRNAVAETEAVREEAALLVIRLSDCIEDLEKTNSIEVNGKPEQETDQAMSFFLRELHGKIGVFTSDGNLIRIEAVTVDALPHSDREALKKGIFASNYTELENLLQDYKS